ncbi:MAG: nitronate monooxygenase [Candidatus Vecturithrix sp.]|jgi:nitronate monooxygenase|nr:nitronate monooxygenase [Candidatus Vecturithrix sp.]
MAFPALHIGDIIARIPIIQGGMGVGISLSGLASAVANEGGIGVIAAAMIGIQEPDIYTTPQKANIRALTREIRAARARTNGILGVNIMVALTDFSELVKTAIKENIDIIFAGAGLPLDLPKYVNESIHTKLVPIISSARAATLLCKKWLAKFDYLPDAFVVEGPLAGGHLGFKPQQIDDPDFALEKIVPEVIEAVKPYEQKKNQRIPIIAAGGIYTGEDICTFLQMGAAGVQMGTRFVATHECDADMAFKQAYLDAKEGDAIIITSPVGLPGRAIRNQFLDDVAQGKKIIFKCPYHCITTCDFHTAPYCIAAALANAQKGRLQQGFAFVGKNVHRIKEILSVKELIASLAEQFNSCVPESSA